MVKYLILAYKADNEDYCMGCHVASYSSDFQYLNTTDREEALRFLVDKITYKVEDREYGYDFTIFIDGKTSEYNNLNGETTDYDNLITNSEGEYDYDEEPGRKLMADARATIKRNEFDALAKAAAAARRAQTEAEEAYKIEEARKEREREAHDRKEFERLTAKFGGK
jgi:hypothetical protein